MKKIIKSWDEILATVRDIRIVDDCIHHGGACYRREMNEFAGRVLTKKASHQGDIYEFNWSWYPWMYKEEREDFFYPKDSYVVLLAGADGGDTWSDIPINYVYKLRADANLHTFMIHKDAKGSTTNGWSLNPTSDYKSKLKLREADAYEIALYESQGKPVNVMDAGIIGTAENTWEGTGICTDFIRQSAVLYTPEPRNKKYDIPHVGRVIRVKNKENFKPRKNYLAK